MKKILLALLFLCPFAAQAQRSGSDYAIFFYATDFQPGWAALPETAKEATELKTELETNFGFTCEAVPNPSKAQILAKIKQYNDRLTENDQVLFFFSMHGHYEDSAERGFLIAADGALKDDYGDTWLSYDDLSGYLARCKAKHVLLALDACHSGAFGIRNKARPEVPTYSQAEDCNQRVAKTFQFQGRQFCTSGNKSSKTPTKSLFASRFLEALRKGGQDGIIRFDDLEYYLGKVENPRPENGTFRGHSPGGDFVFVKKGGCTGTTITPPQNEQGNKDLQAWNKANADKTKAAYQAYKAGNCPGGAFCEAAEARINAILTKDKSDWEAAMKTKTVEALEKYLFEMQDGEFREEAKTTIQQLKLEQIKQKEEAAWKTANETETLEAYLKYMADYPDGKYKTEAQANATRIGLLKKAVAGTDGMMFVPGGTYEMGCSDEKKGCFNTEYPIHLVTLSDFSISKYEVTQKQWDQVMEGKHEEARFRKCDDCPVLVTFPEATDFISRLNKTVEPGQETYRLPTEAEWEYAARECGKSVLFGNGKNIADPKEINFSCDYSSSPYSIKGKSRNKVISVGSFAPNALGLYDMSGNAAEWTSDVFAKYEPEAVTNPTGPSVNIKSQFVIRGGGFTSTADDCRVTARDQGFKTMTLAGLRLVRSK